MMQPPHQWNPQLPGYAIRAMGTSIPVNNGQQQQQAMPTQVLGVSLVASQQLAANSKLSCDAAPFQPRQPTSPPPPPPAPEN